MVVHLERRHKNHLRFHRVVVVQNKTLNDLGHYRYYKCECPDQVRNKIKDNKTTLILMDRKQSKEIVF